MPFDLLKKLPELHHLPADPKKDRGSKKDRLRGMPFEAQEEELRPKDDKRKGTMNPFALLKNRLMGSHKGGGKEEGGQGVMRLLSTEEKAVVLDLVDAARQAGQQVSNMQRHFASAAQVRNKDNEWQAKGWAKFDAARALLPGVLASSNQVVAASADALELGKADRLDSSVKAFADRATELQVLLVGHTGSGGWLADGSFLLNPISQLKGGRAPTKAETELGNDPRQGATSQVDPEGVIPCGAINGNMGKQALTNYAPLYSDYVAEFVKLAALR